MVIVDPVLTTSKKEADKYKKKGIPVQVVTSSSFKKTQQENTRKFREALKRYGKGSIGRSTIGLPSKNIKIMPSKEQKTVTPLNEIIRRLKLKKQITPLSIQFENRIKTLKTNEAQASQRLFELRNRQYESPKLMEENFNQFTKQANAFIERRLLEAGLPVAKATEFSVSEIKKFPNSLSKIRKNPREFLNFIVDQKIKKLTNRLEREVKQAPTSFKAIKKNPKIITNELKRLAAITGVAASKFVEKKVKVALTSPDTAILNVGGTLVDLYLGSKGLEEGEKIIIRGLNRLDPKFKKVVTTELGEKEIRGIKGLPEEKIELIPSGKIPQLETSPIKVVEKTNIPIKKKPTVPKTKGNKKAILDIVKKRGDVVTGSFAQKTLLKKKFTRTPKDLDILTKNQDALQREIKRKLGSKVKFETLNIKSDLGSFKVIRIRDTRTGKLIADLDPIGKAEEGFLKKYGTLKVNGIKFTKPQVRLAAKVKQLSKRKGVTQRKKVIKDIELLTGKKVDLNKPTIRGAFGYSKKELKALVGKSGPIATSQVDLLGRGIIKPKELKLQRVLYASPFNPKTKVAQTRITRLGVISEKEANLLDYLSGDISKAGKPQVFIFPKEKILPKSAKGKGFRVPLKSSELEVVLDEGYIIKRGKKIATTNIEGKPVPIYEIEKIKPSKTLKTKINKFKKGKLTKKQIKALDKELKKATNFDYKLSKPISSVKKLKKVVNLKSKVGSSLLNAVKRRTKLKISRVPSRKKPSRAKSKVSITRKGSPPSRPSRGKPSPQPSPRPSPPQPSPRPSPRPTPRPPTKVPPKVPKGSKKRRVKKTKKTKVAWIVEEKYRGKFRRVGKKPLSEKDALDRLAYTLDNRLSRTARIRPVGEVKNIGNIPTKEKGYFSKNKQKLREYKIKRKRKINTPRKFIEKRKYGFNTQGEKRQAQALRKQRLKNLAKARKVLKKKKK